MEFAIVDSNPLLDFKSDQNRHPNLESKFELLTTIRFGDPNRLSLLGSTRTNKSPTHFTSEIEQATVSHGTGLRRIPCMGGGASSF